jgi:hypothetical protein
MNSPLNHASVAAHLVVGIIKKQEEEMRIKPCEDAGISRCVRQYSHSSPKARSTAVREIAAPVPAE